MVGAGPAGCVAARTLADRGIDVILLEVGPGSPRPDALDDLNHLRTAAANTDTSEWWWDEGPRRGRGLGGGSAVNGMVLHAIDPLDARRWGWDWDDAREHQTQILRSFQTTEPEPGPMTRAFGELVTRGVPIGRSTMSSGAEGWCPLSLAAVDGRRISAADAFLADAPSSLVVRCGAEVDRVEGFDVVLSSGERIGASHVVLAGGAIGSPALLVRSGLLRPTQVGKPLNHASTAVIAELAPDLQVSAPVGPPSSRLLRLQTGLTEHRVIDLQILVLDHTGAHENGRRHAAVIVSALEYNRKNVLIAGITQVLRWLAEMPSVVNVSLSDDPSPVQHHCATLADVLGGGNAVPGAGQVSVIDGSTLPALPHTNPMVPIMVGARRWASRHQLGSVS